MARLFTLPAPTERRVACNPFRVGTGAAFTEVIQERQAMVYSIAFRFLRQREAAEELAQEVFLELYRLQPVFETDAHLVFWLRKTTSHRCIDQARRAKLRHKIGLDEIPEPVAWSSPRDPLIHRTVDETLTTLAEMPRLVMILRYQEDLNPAEIAALLDLPLTTVKSHLQRSLAVLRERLRIPGKEK